MDLRINFRIDERELENLLKDEIKTLVKKLDLQIQTQIHSIHKNIKDVTAEVFMQEPFFQGLLFGDLAGHFGIPAEDVINSVREIIDIIQDNIQIIFTGIRTDYSKVLGRIQITLNRKVFADLLKSDYAIVITDKGESLPWIDWSLFHGDEIIISDHSIYLDEGLGRSGLAIMVKNKIGGYWKVPSEISGTADNNWLTEGFNKLQNIYNNLILQTVKIAFSRIK